MSNINELFWNASLTEIKQGYVYRETDEAYTCLICGKRFACGIIHPMNGTLYESRKAVERHIVDGHGSVFAFLLPLEKKLTGLTDHQKNLLESFHAGRSDADTAKALGTSTSTIRNHRFQLRERQKQAKIFLALMELLQEKNRSHGDFITIPRTARQVDERFAITEQENADILREYFPQGPEGPLRNLPVKEKRRVAILRHLVAFFDPEVRYTEQQVNEILKRFHPDCAMLRRNLIEYGFLDRVADGSAYWVKMA
ncbi:MAG TPA: DUF2087 domain-containing protein [Candidatus Ozemobacteraceae bacterium]|nr:DUF2087 domain-containing protein [Candidatus Ozemobacteraceae bacterium]HQG27163.1 DUF2087 domain-containing protein [Candidatus Ozemobacteraceae bacterium]